jgi:hypothetical protein
MKLSEVKGEKALDMLADLIEPIMEIIEDKEVSKILKSRHNKDKADSTKIILGRAVSAAIKNHKKAVITILATLDDIPVDQYECNLLSLPKKMMDIINDPAIFDLFTSQSQET